MESNPNDSLVHTFVHSLTHSMLLIEPLSWARHCHWAVDTGVNVTGRVPFSWGFCSGSGASHQKSTPGMGEGAGKGLEPPQESPSGASQRTSLTLRC